MVEEFKYFLKAARDIQIESYPPDVPTLKIHLVSMTYMFNMLQNDSDKILMFDMRSTMDQVRSHINFTFQNDSVIPIPSDVILKNNLAALSGDPTKELLKVAEFQKWIKKEIFENSTLKKLNMVNEKKEKKFAGRKRQYVFVVPTQKFNVDQFTVGQVFDPKYALEIYNKEASNPKVLEDYLSLKNAVLLIAALKKERIHREVYLLDDSITNFE